MTVHKFSCSKKHEFYFSLGLPVELTTFTELIAKITCPICQCKEINIHAGEVTFQEVECFKVGDYAIEDGKGVVFHITNDDEKRIINANGGFRKATEDEIREYHKVVAG